MTRKTTSENAARSVGTRNSRLHLRLLLFLCLSTAGLHAGCREESSHWPNTPFSSEKWLLTPETQRFAFVNDLVRSKTLIGKSRDEVIALLGDASDEGMAPRGLTYVVKSGPATPFSFNQVFALSVDLRGDKGEVVAVGVNAD